MIYDQELIRSFLDEAKSTQDSDAEKKEKADQKLRATVEKTSTAAKLAFEQAQNNRFLIDSLRKELKKTRIIAIIAIIIAIICMSVTMVEEMNQIAGMMP